MTTFSRFASRVQDAIAKSRDRHVLGADELTLLHGLAPGSPESFAVMAEARRLSMALNDGLAEVHGQFAVNMAPCPINCAYCAFAARAGVFTERWELAPDEAAARAAALEAEGANAIYLMATDNFDHARYLEIGQETRRTLRAETALTANVGDVSPTQARQLREAGFTAVNHSLRLREGVDTNIPPEIRQRSIRHFQEVGLAVGLSVSPVGPEHTPEELAALTRFHAAVNPAYSGLCRRVTVPGSPLAAHGMISDLRKAHALAVTRLGLPHTIRGLCVHEPDALSVAAGANILFAEEGANPRDTHVETEKWRGWSVTRCMTLLADAEWMLTEGPSRLLSPTTTQQGESA